MSSVLLSLKNISKQYPGVLALNDVSLDVYEGETLALVGENGAGKSTLIKTLSGSILPSEGKIIFEGNEYDHMTPKRSSDLGISVVYQEFNLMNTLSVAENVYVGRLPMKNGLYDKKKCIEDAKKIFEEMEVDIDVTKPVEELSVAYMQLVEIAKNLAKQTKLLIMDEPTAPLTEHECGILFRIMKQLKQRGVTIIFISHRMNEIFDVCDRAAVMRDGQLISTHEIKDITRAGLIADMVGRDMSEAFPTCDKTIGETVLEVRNLSGNGVRNINFELRRGEILGLAGLVGAGRTEIMRILYGADLGGSGEVYLHGKKVFFHNPKEAVQHGIVLIPEDRKREGVLLTLPIAQNISLPNLKAVSHAFLMNFRKEKEIVDKQKDDLKIACYSAEQLAGTLSGGNQQKVVLAKWLASTADILIFDEPTRGIDVGAKQEIYNLMNKLCMQGMSIIMISSEMEEMIGMSDRIVVLYEGRQTGVLEKSEFSQEAILTLASGESLARS
ncbi:MAG: sugar ABC transporter ATP-binding protein [Solobacterium sp.]|nr:sugar ABC transporter ATP-binding protein [Solobacterium sp.]